MNGKEPSRRELKSSEPGWHVPLSELGPPEMIEIEPIHTCNLRCVMCHVSYEKLTHEKLEEVARTVIEGDLRIIVSSASYQRAFPLKEQWPGNFFSNLVLSNNPAARLICHPRSHIQNGAYPGMSVDCRSAFKYARILYNGDVHLCDKFRIGNIHEKSLLEIWHGEEANRIRQLLLQSPTLCHACDYYRFCIKAAQVDYDKEENFKMVARRFEGDSPEERRLRALYEDLAEPVTVAPGAPPEHPVTQTPMEI